MSPRRSLLSLSAILALVLACRAERFRVTDRAYLDLTKDGEPIGRVTVGLFGDLAPKAVDNFKRIASEGIAGKTYAGTRFHRIFKRFMIQGGDVLFDNGTGSASSFGGEFEDENLEAKYEVSGLVSMANRGRDTNGCQFFINTVPTPWLNGKHTIFGKVVEGQGLIHVVEHEPADPDGTPSSDVRIAACGLLPKIDAFYVSDRPYDLQAWIRAAAVPLTMSFAILGFFHWMIRKMEI